MSELIKCDSCGELSSFLNTTFIHYTPLCPSCHEEKENLLQTTDHKSA